MDRPTDWHALIMTKTDGLNWPRAFSNYPGSFLLPQSAHKSNLEVFGMDLILTTRFDLRKLGNWRNSNITFWSLYNLGLLHLILIYINADFTDITLNASSEGESAISSWSFKSLSFSQEKSFMRTPHAINTFKMELEWFSRLNFPSSNDGWMQAMPQVSICSEQFFGGGRSRETRVFIMYE